MEKYSSIEGGQNRRRPSLLTRSRLAFALICAGLVLGGCKKEEKEEAKTESKSSAESRKKFDEFFKKRKKAEEPEKPKEKTCPKEMVKVKGDLCVDRYEGTLVDMKGKRPVSRFYPPTRSQTIFSYNKWGEKAGESGAALDTSLAVPAPPAWQVAESFDIVAESKPGVFPNAYVNFVNAQKACENAGKRLCTRDEWMTACKGEAGTKYPYGDEYKVHECNVFRWTHPGKELHDDYTINHDDPRLLLVKDKRGRPLLRKTGTTEKCASEWGEDAIYDMAGNVDEWVVVEKGDGKFGHAFMGGFFSRNTKNGCESTFGKGHGKRYQDYTTGLRCCRDAE